MNKETLLYSLLKFGRSERIIDLYKTGNIFVQSVHNLKKDKTNEFRGDHYEGGKKAWSYPPGTAKLKLGDGKIIELNYLKLTTLESYEFTLGNVLSLYAISSRNFNNPTEFKIDERMKSFGSHYLLIHNVSEFMDRIKNDLHNKKLNAHFGFVEYFDEGNYQGDLHLFMKRKSYEYQSEFRFYIDSKIKEGLELNLGSLQDISYICDASDLSIIKTLQLSE